jgi:hypothetical protein
LAVAPAKSKFRDFAGVLNSLGIGLPLLRTEQLETSAEHNLVSELMNIVKIGPGALKYLAM